jgi:DNA modification methylase
MTTTQVGQDYEPAVPVDRLSEHPDNPRRGDVDAIDGSMAQHGFYGAVYAQRSSGRIVAGNHRYRVARQRGHATVPVIWLDVDDDQARRILLVDNRTGDQGGYDDAELERVLRDLLDGSDLGLVGTGYTVEDLTELFGEPEPEPGRTDPDDVPEPPSEPVTRTGDVWLLGDHRIICGDCRSTQDVQVALGGHRAMVAFTSPPYASQRRYDEASEFQPIRPDDYVDWFEAVQANVRAVIEPTGSWLLNINAHAEDGQRHLYVMDLTLAHVRRWGWRFVDELCWVDAANGIPGAWPNRFKDAWEPIFHYTTQADITFNPLANGHESNATFEYSPANTKSDNGSGLLKEPAGGRHEGWARPSNVITVASGGSPDHPAVFPVALPEWFVRAYSNEGDVIFDPFVGAGSTLVAAHRQGRVGVGMDISPTYCDVACRRLQAHTGITPVLEATGEPHDFTAEVGEAA